MVRLIGESFLENLSGLEGSEFRDSAEIVLRCVVFLHSQGVVEYRSLLSDFSHIAGCADILKVYRESYATLYQDYFRECGDSIFEYFWGNMTSDEGVKDFTTFLMLFEHPLSDQKMHYLLTRTSIVESQDLNVLLNAQKLSDKYGFSDLNEGFEEGKIAVYEDWKCVVEPDLQGFSFMKLPKNPGVAAQVGNHFAYHVHELFKRGVFLPSDISRYLASLSVLNIYWSNPSQFDANATDCLDQDFPIKEKTNPLLYATLMPERNSYLRDWLLLEDRKRENICRAHKEGHRIGPYFLSKYVSPEHVMNVNLFLLMFAVIEVVGMLSQFDYPDPN